LSDRTLDTLADLAFWQNSEGYRFGLDAVLLGTRIQSLAGKRIADLGAGHGPVSCMIAHQFPDSEVWAIERQQGLFELLEQNVVHNKLVGRVHGLHRDLRELRALNVELAQSFDLVVSNPPFYREREGRTSPTLERREAHHELNGGLQDFLDVGRWLLKPRGYMKLVIPPARLAEIFDCARSSDFGVKELRFVYAQPGVDAYLMEVVLRRDFRGSPVVREYLVVHQDERFSEEVQQRLELK